MDSSVASHTYRAGTGRRFCGASGPFAGLDHSRDHAAAGMNGRHICGAEPDLYVLREAPTGRGSTTVQALLIV